MSIAVYEPLLNRLREDIRRGKFGSEEMLGTEMELARRTRISRDSVRLAIDSLIEEGLVERRAGKGVFVRKPSSALIAELIVPGLHGIWADVALGAQAVGREQGFKVQIFNAHGSFQADLDAVRRLPLTDVDGAIVGSVHQRQLSEAVIELHQKRFPLVVVDQRLQDVDVPSVVFDNHGAGYRAGQELLRLGHRRIGFIGYAQEGTLRGRLDGLRDAISDAGIPFDRSLLVEVPLEVLTDWGKEPQLHRSIEQLLQRADRPSAILCHHEGFAMRAYRVARQLVAKIPDDLSVVGIGNIPESEWMEPPLAIIGLPAVEMGRVAMEMLLQRISDPRGAREHRVLPATWVGRESVGSPKQ